jgi:hypothetical protein
MITAIGVSGVELERQLVDFFANTAIDDTSCSCGPGVAQRAVVARSGAGCPGHVFEVLNDGIRAGEHECDVSVVVPAHQVWRVAALPSADRPAAPRAAQLGAW